jgi:hypothetical protein
LAHTTYIGGSGWISWESWTELKTPATGVSGLRGSEQTVRWLALRIGRTFGWVRFDVAFVVGFRLVLESLDHAVKPGPLVTEK